MLEYPSIQRYFEKSDNAFVADNQQERLKSNFQNPQRLHAGFDFFIKSRKDIVRTLWRHREANRNDLLFHLEGNSSSEIPCQVSSDPHERCNDLGTVSTKDPVKSQ